MKKTVANSKRNGPSVKRRENVKKRLELLYPEKYSLEIKEEKGYFVTDLKLLLGH